VNLAPVRVEGEGLRFPDELAALIDVAMEVGVADLPGAIPSPRATTSPLAETLGVAGEQTLDVRLVLHAEGQDVAEATQSACLTKPGAEEVCITTTATVQRARPWDAVAPLLAALATQLGAQADTDRVEAWSTPASRDPYAELVTGRAAHALTAESSEADTLASKDDDTAVPRLTHAVRAVRIDPQNALAQLVLARAELARAPAVWIAPAPEAPRDEAAERRRNRMLQAARQAASLRPDSAWLAAQLAVTEARAGRPAEAREAWAEAERRAGPEDLRFVLARARAEADGGDTSAAVARAAQLAVVLPWDGAVHAFHAQVCKDDPACADDVAHDARLDAWQRTAPRAQEPVRARVGLRVERGAWDEALAFLPALRARGATGVDAVETALLAAMGRFEDAAARAPGEVGAALRYRADVQGRAGAPPSGLAESSWQVRVARAEAALARGENADAAALAEQLLRDDDRPADGWRLRAEAREAQGRLREASDDWLRAWERDPALKGGPVNGARIASTFVTLEAAPTEAPRRTREPGRRGRGKGPEL
jgi:tetratricopeptide (TPR) repeat protein